MWRGPFRETVCDQILVESAVRIREEDPRVFGERFLELVDVAVVEPIDIQLNDSNDLIRVRRRGSHV
jgi:hypothetical protein